MMVVVVLGLRGGKGVREGRVLHCGGVRKWLQGGELLWDDVGGQRKRQWRRDFRR